MIMRSAPPSSAHLADKPVPAPAPIMSSPRATTDCSLTFQSGLPVFIRFLGYSGLSIRSRRMPARKPTQFQKQPCRAVCKDGVIDIAVDLDHGYLLVHPGANRVKTGTVSRFIP